MTHLISVRTRIHSSPFDHVISPSTCEIDLFSLKLQKDGDFQLLIPTGQRFQMPVLRNKLMNVVHTEAMR